MWARGMIEKTQLIGMRKNRDEDRLAALHLSLETRRQRKWISRDLSTDEAINIHKGCHTERVFDRLS